VFYLYFRQDSAAGASGQVHERAQQQEERLQDRRRRLKLRRDGHYQCFGGQIIARALSEAPRHLDKRHPE
jgi:hypothetical protein